MLSFVKAKRNRYLPIEEEAPENRRLQSNNNRVLGIAYECDDFDFPLELPKIRRYRPGDIIKVCIKPEVRTERRGIVMRSVDTMNFIGEGSGISQKVIEYKKEFFTALSKCIPGQLVCSFKTTLKEELFWGLEGDEVNVTGVALVTMEYIDESFALNGLADFDIPVDLTFLVKRVAPPPGAVLGVPGAEAIRKQCNPHWWCQYPDWFKIIMIVLILLVFCCCCAMCLTLPCMVREVMADDREREERRQFIKEQKMREENPHLFQDEQYYEDDPYAEDFDYVPQYEEEYDQAPPQQRSYQPEPAYEEPPRQQSSYRVPRAENSSFRAAQRGSQQYEY